MTKQQEQQAYAAMVERLNTPEQKQAIKQAVVELDGDGHSILDPQFFLTKGIDGELLMRLTQTFESSKEDPKWEITKDGKRIEELEGIWSLTFLTTVARAYDVKYASAFGRGTQARLITRALLEGPLKEI